MALNCSVDIGIAPFWMLCSFSSERLLETCVEKFGHVLVSSVRLVR